MTRRLLRWSLALLLAAALLAAAGAWFVVCTQAGLRQALALAQRFSGGAVEVGAAQGRLLDEFVLTGLRYTGADGTVFEAARVHLRLHARELLWHRLHLELAEVADARLRLPPPAAAASTASTRLPAAPPLDLLLDSFSLKNFQLLQGRRQGADIQLLQVDNLDLSARWIGARIELARLDLDLPDTGPLSLRARLRLAGDRVEIAALSVQGPGQVQAKGTFGIGQAPSDLQLQWQNLRWPLKAAAGAPLVANARGQGRFTGLLDRYRFELDSDALAHALAVHLSARGSGDLRGARFEALELVADQGAAGKGSVRAQGSLGWDPAVRADLKAQFQNLDPALFAADWSGALNGTLSAQTQMHGAEPDIAFVVAIDHSTLRGHPLTLSAQGSTNLRQARLQALSLQSGKGSVSASGSVSWEPELRVDAQAQLSALDPGQFLPRWNGSLSGTLQAQTQTRDGKADIAFAVQLDRSQLRGYPLQLAAHGELRGRDTVVLQDLQLSSGATRLAASGQATPPFALAGSLDSPDLAALLPDLAGRASFKFKLDGALEDPHLVAAGDAHGLRYRQYRIAGLVLDADLQPSRPSHLNLALSDGWAGLAVPSAKLSLSGSQTYHQAQLDVRTERGDAGFAVDGGYDAAKREWGGRISAAHLAPANLPPWSLEQPAGLLLGAQRQSLEPACLSGGSGRVCVRLEENVTREGLRLSWNLEHLLLASFKPLMPSGYTVQGQIDGSGSVEIAHRDVAAMDADLKLEGVRLQAPDAPPLEMLPSSLKATDDNGRLRLVVDLRLPQGTVGADVAAAPADSFDARPLSGDLRVNVPDLSFVTPLLPELQAVGGSIDGALQFGGTAGLPKLLGQIVLSDGRAKLVTPSILLEQVQLRVSGNGSGPLAVDGSMHSGGGTLAIDGTLDPSAAPPRADLKLKGADFQALATPDAHVWITPDLHLLSDAGGIHIDGSLTVPKAQITPRGFGDNGVAVSRDQVIVGAEAPPESPSKVYSTVRVVLGEAVNFEGMGLTARMGGAVTLIEQPQRETLAQGELRVIEGSYKAYGQDLNIETGRLIFDGGPVTQPAVDLYATRHPQSDITIGVRVRGTLDKPLLSLTSDPEMAREQQLSWLVLGRPLDQTSTSDRSMVSQAALSLGLSGGDYLAQKVGKGVGLDQISLGAGPPGGSDVTASAAAIQGSQAAQLAGTTPGASQAAQLTLGKYLTPRLFVSYGVSLFQPGQTFRMLYTLGHGFKLQTESGVASGGDVLYTVERGH